jgi:mRNA interferase MazF
VLTRDAAIPLLNQVTVAYATTTIRGHRAEVPLDESDGMPRPCVVNTDMVTRLPTAWLTERITVLSAERMHAVCRALAIALDCG